MFAIIMIIVLAISILCFFEIVKRTLVYILRPLEKPIKVLIRITSVTDEEGES